MGSGIAQVFAANPFFHTRTFDSNVPLDHVLERVRSNLKILIGENAITDKQAKSILSNIYPRQSLKEAVTNVDVIIECVPEDMKLKQDLFKELEVLCRPDTIFATNTSVMSINEIFEKISKKDRVLGTHFWNPPYLIPLVEVIRSDHTDGYVIERTLNILKQAGKHPVKVNKDVPGFIANRLQHALWREAISIIENGIADAETVDQAIKLSFGMRLPVLGPLENIDMVGTDLTLSIHRYMFRHLENSTEPSPLLKKKVQKGEIGFKTGEGFQKWTQQRKDDLQKKLIKHLIRSLNNK